LTETCWPVGYSTLILRHRNFALLWLSQFLAYFAIWTSNIALLHLVYTAMDSSLGPGLLLSAQFLPAFFLMPVASRIVERYGQRRVILASTICNGGLALVLPFCSSTLPIACFFAIYVLYSASITMFVIAGLTLLPLVVTRADLTRANCLLLATPSTMMVLSGASFIAQPLAGLNQQGEFVVVATLFFASAAVFSRISRLRSGADTKAPHHGVDVLRGFLAGLSYLFRHRELAQVFAIRMAFYIGVGGQVLLTLYSEEFFDHGESGTGLLYMARGLAMLIGGFGLAQLVMTKGLRSVDAIAFGLALFGLGYLMASAVSGFGIAAVALLLGIGFLGEGLLKSMTMTLIQQRTHPDYLARVIAADQGLSAMIQSATALVIATCVVTDIPSTVLWASAVTGALLIVASLAWVVMTRSSPRPQLSADPQERRSGEGQVPPASATRPQERNQNCPFRIEEPSCRPTRSAPNRVGSKPVAGRRLGASLKLKSGRRRNSRHRVGQPASAQVGDLAPLRLEGQIVPETVCLMERRL